MKLSEKRRLDRIILGLLAMLGFGAAMAGCDDGAFRGGSEMYGVPHAEFEVKVTVTDENGQPIEGIEISEVLIIDGIPVVYLDPDGVPVKNSGLTDMGGKYTINHGVGIGWESTLERTLEITAKDIDGTANGGEFAPKTKTITATEADYTGGSGDWYEGKLSKTVDFTLSQETEQ